MAADWKRLDEQYSRDLGTLAQVQNLRADEAPQVVEIVQAAALRPEPIRWLWPGWLACGKLHVLAGAPGTGKTTIAMDVAACVSSGRALPSGWLPRRSTVLIWSGEDDPADTLVPRLIAAGADLASVRFVGDVRDNDDRYPFDPARDVPKLAAALAGMDDVGLLIVDPLVFAVSGDSHKNAEVRRGLAPLVDLAVKTGAALLGITHYSKGTQGRDPLERVSGSLAFGALARIVLGTVKQEAEEEQPQRMMLARAKSNIGPDGGGFTYEIEQTELPGGITTSRIAWKGAVDGTARNLLTEIEQNDEGGDDAASFLRSLLDHGSRAAKEIYREAEAAGFSRDQMKRAKRKLRVVAVKAGMDAGWVWRLSEGGSNAVHALPSLPSSKCALPSPNNVAPFQEGAPFEGCIEGSEGSEGSGREVTAHPSSGAVRSSACPEVNAGFEEVDL